MFKNIKISKFSLIHLISLTFSYFLSELYFFSSKGVDFPKYFVFLENFFYTNIDTLNNQGLFYYYANALVIISNKSSLNSLNSINFYNATIQFTNLIFYLIGIFGLFKILKVNGFKNKTIYVSLSILHFVPKIIEMRVLLKPEILVFSFLPWIILGVDNYFKNKNAKFLFLSMFPLSILLTSKGSITAMVTIFIFFKYLKKINKKNIKELFISLILLIVIIFCISYENFNYTNYNFLEFTTSENYDNRADISFLYTLNFWDLFFSPNLGSHNNSSIAITLYDTFGDYYEVNIYNLDNYFSYYQDFFFQNSFNLYEKYKFNLLFKNYLSFLLTITFYFLIFSYVFRSNKWNIYLHSPLIGFSILLINSFGFPGNNFDPNLGDTVKVSYYAFFIGFAVVYLLCDLFTKNNNLLNIVPVFLGICFLIILGFPKSNYSEINDNLDSKIQVSLFCLPLSIVFDNTKPSDCNNQIKLHCEYNLLSNYAQFIQSEPVPNNFTRVYREDTPFGEIISNNLVGEFIEEGGYSLEPVIDLDEIKFINKSQTLMLFKNNEIIKTSSISDCKKFISQGYLAYNDLPQKLLKIPFFNIIFGLISIFYFFYISKQIRLIK